MKLIAGLDLQCVPERGCNYDSSFVSFAELLIVYWDFLMCPKAALPQDHAPQFPCPSGSGGVAEGGDTHSRVTGHSHHPHPRQCGQEVKHFLSYYESVCIASEFETTCCFGCPRLQSGELAPLIAKSKAYCLDGRHSELLHNQWCVCIGYTTPTRRIYGVHILRVGVTYSTIKGPPPSNNSIHNAYCKKSKPMPDFVAVKELVEQQVVSYRLRLVQALCIRRPLLQLQALLGKNVSKPCPWTRGGLAILL